MSDSLQNELTALRRRLHATAELSGQEFGSAAIIAEALAASMPDEVVRDLGVITSYSIHYTKLYEWWRPSVLAVPQG